MENRVDISLPSRWSMLKPGQVEGIAGLFLRCKTQEELLTQCFLYLSGWRVIRWRMFTDPDGENFFFRTPDKRKIAISGGVFTTIINHLKWIAESFTVTAYVPAIKGYKIPNKLLYGISLEQYLMADTYYSQFVGNGNFHLLDCMISLLYCSNIKQLDVQHEARKIATISRNSRYAVFIWYSGVKQFIHNKYPYLFGSSGEPDSPDESVMKILSALNGGDITRNRFIMESPMHEAFYELNAKIENAQTKK